MLQCPCEQSVGVRETRLGGAVVDVLGLVAIWPKQVATRSATLMLVVLSASGVGYVAQVRSGAGLAGAQDGRRSDLWFVRSGLALGGGGWGREVVCRVWKPASRASSPASNRPWWCTPLRWSVTVVMEGICSRGSAEKSRGSIRPIWW